MFTGHSCPFPRGGMLKTISWRMYKQGRHYLLGSVSHDQGGQQDFCPSCRRVGRKDPFPNWGTRVRGFVRPDILMPCAALQQ